MGLLVNPLFPACPIFFLSCLERAHDGGPGPECKVRRIVDLLLASLKK